MPKYDQAGTTSKLADLVKLLREEADWLDVGNPHQNHCALLRKAADAIEEAEALGFRRGRDAAADFVLNHRPVFGGEAPYKHIILLNEKERDETQKLYHEAIRKLREEP